MKRTPWFNVSQPPSKIGWFEFRASSLNTIVERRWWDGVCWRSGPGGYSLQTWLSDQWRGLTERPK